MFVDEHRERFGVEPICNILEVSASAYYQRAKGERSARELEDERLLDLIAEIHQRNYHAYGDRRMWIALRRAGEEVGRARVARLMREAGIQGAKRRGRPWRTTTPDPAALRRPDLVQRDFSATGSPIASGAPGPSWSWPSWSTSPGSTTTACMKLWATSPRLSSRTYTFSGGID